MKTKSKVLIAALLALPLLGCAPAQANTESSPIAWRTDAQRITVFSNSGPTNGYATYFPIRWAYEAPALYLVDEKSMGREFYNVAFEVVLKAETDANR